MGSATNDSKGQLEIFMHAKQAHMSNIQTKQPGRPYAFAYWQET